MPVLGVKLMSMPRFVLIIALIIGLAGCGRNERMDLLYAQRCVTCHGLGGRGDGAVAAELPVRTPDFRETV